MKNIFSIVQKNDQTIIQIESGTNRVLVVILAFFALCGMFATLASVWYIIDGSESMMILLIAVLSPFATLLLGRLWLWNAFGKETITITPGSIEVTYDYKLWKDSREYPAPAPSLSFRKTEERKGKEIGKIVVEGSEVKSVLAVWREEFESVELIANC